MYKAKVPQKTIARLSHYARCLRRAQSTGTSVVTSVCLSERCRISSAVVRKDLSLFGEFGKQGLGYNVHELLNNIERILGTSTPPSIIIIGAGKIGSALLESGLEDAGKYTYTAIFDSDESIIGNTLAGLTVRSPAELKQTIENLDNVIAVVVVPPGEGQTVIDKLVDAGCNAVLSMTLEPLKVPPDVKLQYVEIFTKLDILSHYLKFGGDSDE